MHLSAHVAHGALMSLLFTVTAEAGPRHDTTKEVCFVISTPTRLLTFVPKMETKTREKRPREGGKTREEDSKLPVEEDAGIRSDISHVVDARPRVSSVLKGSRFCSHAKPWLQIERKYDVQHLPGWGGDDEVPSWFPVWNERHEKNLTLTPAGAFFFMKSPLRSLAEIPRDLLEDSSLFLLNITFTS